MCDFYQEMTTKQQLLHIKLYVSDFFVNLNVLNCEVVRQFGYFAASHLGVLPSIYISHWQIECIEIVKD